MIRGELIWILTEKFKLGSCLVTWEGETQTCVSSTHSLHRDSFFPFQKRTSPLTWTETPSLLCKQQTARFAGVGQVSLSLEEVLRCPWHGGTGCVLEHTEQRCSWPSPSRLPPLWPHWQWLQKSFSSLPILTHQQGWRDAANLVQQHPSWCILYFWMLLVAPPPV